MQNRVITIDGEQYTKTNADYAAQTEAVIGALGEEMYSALSEAEAIIAGGAILSVFTHQPINDIDVYFKDKKSLADAFVKVTKEWGTVYLGHTDKSITLKDRETETIVQFIYFDYFKDAEAVFESFDFTVCMAAIELSEETNDVLTLGKDFLSDVASRTLHFNAGTKFPYVSLVRTRKYVDRGYKIGKGNLLAIAMACAEKRIVNWQMAKYQLGGVYGNQFELEVKNYGQEDEEPFTIDRLIELTTKVKETTTVHCDYPEIYLQLTGKEY